MRRKARLTSNQYRRIKQDLMADIADALICETTPRVIQNAVNVLEATPYAAWMQFTLVQR